MSDSSRPRAVFAPDDYATIRKALQVYMHNYGNSLDEEESRKIASLLHRLGRVGYET
jgi:hypothetical protein